MGHHHPVPGEEREEKGLQDPCGGGHLESEHLVGLSSGNWSRGSCCCWEGQDGEGEISLLPPTGQNSSADP